MDFRGHSSIHHFSSITEESSDLGQTLGDLTNTSGQGLAFYSVFFPMTELSME